jgi:hypothetical protein
MLNIDPKRASRNIIKWAEMTESILILKRELLRSNHPEWSDDQIVAEINRQIGMLRARKQIESHARFSVY